MASVIDSGAGPPLEQLYLIPKSLSGPPGLWLAVRIMPARAREREREREGGERENERGEERGERGREGERKKHH